MKSLLLLPLLFLLISSQTQTLTSSQLLSSLNTLIDSAMIEDKNIRDELKEDAKSLSNDLYELFKKQIDSLDKEKPILNPKNLMDELNNPQNLFKYINLVVQMQKFLEKIKKHNKNPDLNLESLENIGKDGSDSNLANLGSLANLGNLTNLGDLANIGNLEGFNDFLKNLGGAEKSDENANFSDFGSLMDLLKGTGGDSKGNNKEIIKKLGDQLKELMKKGKEKEGQGKEEEGKGVYIIGGILAFILFIILLIFIRRAVIHRKMINYEEIQHKPLSATASND